MGIENARLPSQGQPENSHEAARVHLENSFSFKLSPEKPMGYELLHKESDPALFNDVAEVLEQRGAHTKLIGPENSMFLYPALYAWNEEHLRSLLEQHEDTLTEANWPSVPEEFVRRVAQEVAPSGTPLFALVADAFGDTANPGRSQHAPEQKPVSASSISLESLSAEERVVAEYLKNRHTSTKASIDALDRAVQEQTITSSERIRITNEILQADRDQMRAFYELHDDRRVADIENALLAAKNSEMA